MPITKKNKALLLACNCLREIAEREGCYYCDKNNKTKCEINPRDEAICINTLYNYCMKQARKLADKRCNGNKGLTKEG